MVLAASAALGSKSIQVLPEAQAKDPLIMVPVQAARVETQRAASVVAPSIRSLNRKMTFVVVAGTAPAAG